MSAVDVREEAEILSFLFPYPPLFISMTSLTFYYSDACEGCAELEPLVREAARRRGWSFRKVDVEECDTKLCSSMEYVPTVVKDGRKMGFGQLERLINEG